MKPLRVLFVCSGNICRSPLAEAVLRDRVDRLGLADRVLVDSAGIVGDHLGQQSDPRMRSTAESHGISIDHRARRVTRADLNEFDLVVGMDDGHISALESMKRGAATEVRKLREFDPELTGPTDRWSAPDVPDPWYGGMKGFEHVYEMVERSCDALLATVVEEL